jgi:hypothetical protein
VISIVAAIVLQLPPFKPQEVLNNYWRQLAQAKRVYAKLRLPNGTGGKEICECWLEKPSRMRVVTPESEVRSDGKTDWVIVPKEKTIQHLRPQKDDVPAMFEPFYGPHSFKNIVITTWNGTASVLGLTCPTRPGITVLIDPHSDLPLGSTTTADHTIYKTEILELKINPPVAAFSWPELNGFTDK